jgi:8-oxo-dGTP diphosphatase
MDTRVAGYGVIVGDGQILLAHWIGDGGAWTLPGGGAEPGEVPADATVREIREETGYDAAIEGLLGIDEIIVEVRDPADGVSRPLRGVRYVYRAVVVGGELTDEVDGTTDAARWFALDEVHGLVRVPLIDVALRLWRDPQAP